MFVWPSGGFEGEKKMRAVTSLGFRTSQKRPKPENLYNVELFKGRKQWNRETGLLGGGKGLLELFIRPVLDLVLIWP